MAEVGTALGLSTNDALSYVNETVELLGTPSPRFGRPRIWGGWGAATTRPSYPTDRAAGQHTAIPTLVERNTNSPY